MVEHVAASSPLLTVEHRRQFAEEGWCVVDGIYSEAEIAAIDAFFEDYRRIGTAVFDSGMHYEEIDPTRRQLRAMHPHRYSEQAKGWALNPRVIDVLAGLLGRAPLLAQTMYYFKPPGSKGQGMHQDNFYLLAAPATCIAAWTAIDSSEIENGCLYVVPGSHLKDIHCPDKASEVTWNSYGDSHIKPFPPGARAVPVIVPRGSTMFFGGQLIHGSGPNRTKDRSRRTFIGHYINEASDQVAQFYHPVLNACGEVVSRVRVPAGGGPCEDGWLGAQH
jgi:ectoine hydroxylase-related dioxygenase (phytanoyl-CoA dioxygenase family)